MIAAGIVDATLDGKRATPIHGRPVAGIAARAEPIALVVRGGLVESVHAGHVVALDAAGRPVLSAGDPEVTFFPRSALKPLQAVAMLRAGLDLDGPLLALAAASHTGEPDHLRGVRRILGRAGLTEADLGNTPDRPLDPDAGARWWAAGRAAEPVAQNCSGKHAAMLATCVAAGWDTAGYLGQDHPLQRTIRAVVEELTGVVAAHIAVDGCGAPLLSTTPIGLARAFARIAGARPGTPEGRVAEALRGHPWWAAGTGRCATRLVAAVPGLIAKDGADGVLAAALPDGRAMALKVLDGSARPVPAVAAAVLGALGAGGPALAEAGQVDVLGGGTPVGTVQALVGVAPPAR
ncbi:MAG TPA: asparaginase [Pseudonocardia sp.]|nr:asparaginase [Pseudonocardia sp.]